ncbi:MULTISPECIES: hypothetical protein [unclassified Streptomyces]|uniref:hypothetical protein n=1 Tax=unclassified Streptomyces TaxID=2593676 RepID=UPI002DDB802E|nr:MULTISPECIES: hypothetical protein [unclassified Streptomyces]WSF81798.1 hypothetical protein OIE70_00430 [Streptomyces sp. NBC_01744]WSC34166.1 hypothetical protein OHA08_00425 [Streptomyces sp. NBC_01763]WSC41892.1 hypothetical protein OHA08_44555 [Streptomyces sp. NBC_01763]WSC42593.1 hypothetical protein OIE61_00335 [Streptomyces sp. NBC_01762]WSC50260.1 hypothetical protein OIE61_44140 [Streptomyces sp. NBC_01762]
MCRRVALLRERSYLALREFDNGIAEAAADVAVDCVEARLDEIFLITSYPTVAGTADPIGGWAGGPCKCDLATMV